MQEHLKQIVYGGNDGIVTTFAVVAGFAGHGAEGSAAVGGAAVRGLFTFVGFLVFGLAPLLPCFVRAPVPATFAVSVAAIGGAAALAGHQADAGALPPRDAAGRRPLRRRRLCGRAGVPRRLRLTVI